jgi:hypothetical protein
MAKKALTDRKVRSLKAAPKGNRYQVMDALVPGFGVRVTEGGQDLHLPSTVSRLRKSGAARDQQSHLGGRPQHGAAVVGLDQAGTCICREAASYLHDAVTCSMQEAPGHPARPELRVG